MRTWIEAGQPYQLFWRLTLREVAIILEGVTSRNKRGQNDRAWLAWHIEALARQKKLPSLKDLMKDALAKPPRQTPDEQVAIAMQWAAVTRH